MVCTKSMCYYICLCVRHGLLEWNPFATTYTRRKLRIQYKFVSNNILHNTATVYRFVYLRIKKTDNLENADFSAQKNTGTRKNDFDVLTTPVVKFKFKRIGFSTKTNLFYCFCYYLLFMKYFLGKNSDRFLNVVTPTLNDLLIHLSIWISHMETITFGCWGDRNVCLLNKCIIQNITKTVMSTKQYNTISCFFLFFFYLS